MFSLIITIINHSLCPFRIRTVVLRAYCVRVSCHDCIFSITLWGRGCSSLHSAEGNWDTLDLSIWQKSHGKWQNLDLSSCSLAAKFKSLPTVQYCLIREGLWSHASAWISLLRSVQRNLSLHLISLLQATLSIIPGHVNAAVAYWRQESAHSTPHWKPIKIIARCEHTLFKKEL